MKRVGHDPTTARLRAGCSACLSYRFDWKRRAGVEPATCWLEASRSALRELTTRRPATPALFSP